MIMNDDEIQGAVQSMSREILKECQDPDRLLLLGIRGAVAGAAIGEEKKTSEANRIRRDRNLRLG